MGLARPAVLDADLGVQLLDVGRVGIEGERPDLAGAEAVQEVFAGEVGVRDEDGPLRDARDDDRLLLGVVAAAGLPVLVGDGKVLGARPLGGLPVTLGALAVDLGRVVARVDEDHGRVDAVLFPVRFDIVP